MRHLLHPNAPKRAIALLMLSTSALLGGQCSPSDASRTPAAQTRSLASQDLSQPDSQAATSKPSDITQAPFTLELPSEFEQLKPEQVNADATLVARTRDEQVMFMVIASPVPALAGVTPPDTREFRQQALQLMRHNLTGVELIERGERQIGAQQALTAKVMAKVGGQPHVYELAYMQHKGWRYQLIAFSHSASEQLLKQRVDQLVGAWRFKDT